MAKQFDWKGTEVEDRVRRALARGLVAWGETAVSEAKQRVHRLTGTLSRSIHIAPVGYAEGASDHASAKQLPEGPAQDLQDSLRFQLPTWETKDRGVLEVGSWLPYACVEENRHPYMAPAFEAANRQAEGKFRQALAEEGLL